MTVDENFLQTFKYVQNRLIQWNHIVIFRMIMFLHCHSTVREHQKRLLMVQLKNQQAGNYLIIGDSWWLNF